MDEGSSPSRKRAKVIKFPGKKPESPDSRVYELGVFRDYGNEYHLEYLGKNDERRKDVYDGRALSKLAKSLVNDLPSLNIPFSIEAPPRAYLYSEPGFSSVHSPPSSRELVRILRLTDREIRKRRDGWRGLLMHYELRLYDRLDALQERYLPDIDKYRYLIFFLVADKDGNLRWGKKKEGKGKDSEK